MSEDTAPSCQTDRYHQHGAVLIAVLMIIVVVTILGVTAIDTASLEGKLARNYQERTLAFQAAEKALRSGEQFLEGLTAEPVACGSGSCSVWRRGALQELSGEPAKMWWESQPAGWWITRGGSSTSSGPELTAIYIIEERSFVQNNIQANIISSGMNYYTVTAMGVRNGSGARVVLQSHYMKRFN